MDKARLDKITADFCLISGMEASILNSDFHSVSIGRSSGVSLCSLIHRFGATAEICRASDKQRLAEASSGNAITYTCPFGITEAIIPVVRSDSIIAYIISAMGIPEGGEEALRALITEKIPDIDITELDRTISLARRITDREREAYFSMLCMIAEHIAADATQTDDGESIGTLIKYYVKNNLQNKITLTEISRNLHLSTVTLTEHFKSEFGITIMEYVTKKRMDLSEKLLLTTDARLGEIAQAVGFADVEYFSRTFKRFHGISPAAWRKLDRSGESNP